MSAHAIHDYKYTGLDEAEDKIKAACVCGDTAKFPRLAKNRVSAWSAHGAGVVPGVTADETRFVDQEGWSIDETDS
jgi:hypothetical protein